MSVATDHARCSLVVPSHVRLLPIVRLFVASVARTWGVDESTAADLRIGASELAAAAMRPEPDEVRVELEQAAERISVSVSPLDSAALGAGDEPAEDIVGGLFDQFSAEEGVASISIGIGR